MTELLLHTPLQDLLHALLRQTVLLSLVAVVLLVLRRPIARGFGPGLAYASWAALPLLLVVSLMPTNRPVAQIATAIVQQIAPAFTLAQTPALPVPRLPAGSVAALVLTLWALGALAIGARMVWLQRRFGASLARADGGTHWVGAQGPALVGLWPARLVLPPDFEQRFDARQRPLVLAHEEVHRRRLDNHWSALAAALCALHWFNPLAWLALRAMRADQELSCDHAVMRAHPGQEADYSRALMRAQESPSPLQPWSGWRSSHPLIERVAMLAVRPRSRSRRLMGALSLCALALGAAGAVHAVNAAAPDDAKGELIGLEMSMQFNHRVEGVIRDQRMIPKLRVAMHDGRDGMVFMSGGQKPQAGAGAASAPSSPPPRPSNNPADDAPDQVRIEFTPTRVDPTHVRIAYRVTEGGKPRLNSAVLVEDGKEAGLSTTADDGTTEVVLRVRTLPAAESSAILAEIMARKPAASDTRRVQ
ncbi:M56 family metallopeptidase [Roseateles chitosanitabidus]|uniref:M56 family metallopeptidase n=1 Tax=Roseateles chitosanitabidus TaxID=65048 RepID=UPI00082CA825|nr:M56 family metallopeptidase [Roseateles chitosanitabidus]